MAKAWTKKIEAKIKVEFESTNLTLKQLSEKHDVAYSTLRKKASGWNKLEQEREQLQTEVREEIKNELKEELKDIILDEERLKYRLKLQRARRAFGTIQDLYSEDGKLKKIADLTEDEAALIAGIKVNNRCFGHGEDAESWQEQEFKLINADNSLEALEKMLGMYEKDNAQQTPPNNIIINVTDAQLQEIARKLDEKY